MLSLPSSLPSRPLSTLPSTLPLCGECSACCTLMGVPELGKPHNRACVYCAPETPMPCRVYHTRPQSCRDFDCAYKQGFFGLPNEYSSANADLTALRPDNLGVMLYPAGTTESTFVAVETRVHGFDEEPVRFLLEALRNEGIRIVKRRTPFRPIV